MERRIKDIRVEETLPERSKFTSPLLFIHGLWAGHWSWQAYAGYLAHRGWECWAIDLRGRPVQAVGKISLQDYVDDVAEVTGALETQPILIGHDLGGLVALSVAASLRVRALVMLAPLVPRGWTAAALFPFLFIRLKTLPALLWGRPLAPPPWALASRCLLAGLPPTIQQRVWSRLVPDSGALVHNLVRGRLSFPALPELPPLLVTAGAEDQLTPALAARQLAERLHADYQEHPERGHWLLEGPGWEETAASIHRWLVKSLGESLLLPTEEEEE